MSRALQRREDCAGYLFMLPSLIFFVGFVIIPMFICIYLSFTNASMHDKSVFGTFAGFSNYAKLFQDETFQKALANTFLIVLVSVPAVTAFSLWVASAIYKMHNAALSAFRCIF